MTWLRRGVLALALTMVVTVGLLWSLQRSLIYHPDSATPPDPGTVLSGASEITLHTADGLALDAWLVPPEPDGENRDLAALLAPGNGGNRGGRVPLASQLRQHGFTVLLLDYRGYGGNPGSPSEQGLALDADAAVAALTDRGFPPARTIYVGESLGTGVVVALADRHTPAGMVLRSPFPTLADVAAHHYPLLPVRQLLRDEFPVAAHLSGGSSGPAVPVTVIYGSQDTVVPPGLSAQVARAAPNLVEEIVIDGADHNDPMFFGPRVADAVARLADQIGLPPRD